MNSLVDNTDLARLLDRLHSASDAQLGQISEYLGDGDDRRPTGFEPTDSSARTFWHDKLVAIDADKARFVYQVARSMNARHILEAGTSHGVSTLYLAAAIHDNGGGDVVTFEHEAHKADIARSHLDEAALDRYVTIEVGDIRTTLARHAGTVDLLLLDIWAPIAGDVLGLAHPHLRSGAIVIADNIDSRASLYHDLIERLDDPELGYSRVTVPFDGGLAFAIKT